MRFRTCFWADQIRKCGTLFAWAAFCLVPFSVEAKTLYVDPNGNDAVTYANNGPTTPWQSIGRAAWGTTSRFSGDPSQAARAGDVIRIAAGTYATAGLTTGGGGARQDVAYNPVNNGTAGSPIRFECVGVCVLTFSSGAGPIPPTMDAAEIERVSAFRHGLWRYWFARDGD